MKNGKIEILSLATLMAVSTQVNAFNNGDTISFDRGVKECVIPGICEYIPELEFVTKGSYFALDTNGDGFFHQQERVALIPGQDGGIVLGMLQPAPGIDQHWSFAGVDGMHQTTVTPVTQNSDGTLDFSGWEVTWNGGVIQLGSGISATVNCGAALPCTVNDQYHIDYTAMVTSGPFYGLQYQLHLENVENLPSLDVALSIDGGDIQECASIGGHTATATANVTLINGAQLDSLQWTVDGQNAGVGVSISPFLSLGSHTVSVTAISLNGYQNTATTTVTVSDTKAPTVTAEFVDNRTGANISLITAKNSSFVDVKMSADDICDASPSVSGIGGFSLMDGDTLKIQGNLDKVELKTSVLEMAVKAIDSSNNAATVKKTLTITP